MKTLKEFETQFAECLSPENSGIEAPPLSFVWEARAKVAARKQAEVKKPGIFEWLLIFIQPRFKTYPMGLGILLAFFAIFYLNEPNYKYSKDAVMGAPQDLLSVHNSTISVNSTTMLTSIPTLVIRN